MTVLVRLKSTKLHQEKWQTLGCSAGNNPMKVESLLPEVSKDKSEKKKKRCKLYGRQYMHYWSPIFPTKGL